MHLNKLIDLIAEVAAKRVTREGQTKAEHPDEVLWGYGVFRALMWQLMPNFLHISYI